MMSSQVILEFAEIMIALQRRLALAATVTNLIAPSWQLNIVCHRLDQLVGGYVLGPRVAGWSFSNCCCLLTRLVGR